MRKYLVFSLFSLFTFNCFCRTTTNSIADDIVGPVSSSNTNGKLNSMSNSNSLTNVMTVGDMKQSAGTQNGEDFHLNSCKSLNGISSLVSDALKSGVTNNYEQAVKTLGINGTDISQSWKNFAISPSNHVNNTSNSSGENSSTSLNEMGRVRYNKILG